MKTHLSTTTNEVVARLNEDWNADVRDRIQHYEPDRVFSRDTFTHPLRQLQSFRQRLAKNLTGVRTMGG
jgi:hypothetical protein